MFIKSCGDDLDHLVDVTCSYVAFCRDMIIPCKRVKVYPNNKPWVTKSVKSSIQENKLVFKQGVPSDLHIATKELKIEIQKAKQTYKSELENKMAANNLGSAWASLKTITGLQNIQNSSLVTLEGFNSDADFANALNCFYNRFDISDFSNEIQELSDKLKDNQHFDIDQNDVEKAFLSMRVNKSCGPDNICGRLLKACAKELSPVFTYILISLYRYSVYLRCGKMLW